MEQLVMVLNDFAGWCSLQQSDPASQAAGIDGFITAPSFAELLENQVWHS